MCSQSCMWNFTSIGNQLLVYHPTKMCQVSFGAKYNYGGELSSTSSNHLLITADSSHKPSIQSSLTCYNLRGILPCCSVTRLCCLLYGLSNKPTSIPARLRRARKALIRRVLQFVNVFSGPYGIWMYYDKVTWTGLCAYLNHIEPHANLENRFKFGWVMRFFLNNFSASGLIFNRFSGTPSGEKYASVDVSYIRIGWETTSLRGYKHTDTHRQTYWHT